MANVVFKYVTMTGQPLKEVEIQEIVDASLVSAQNSEKIANALVSRLASKNVETKHKASVSLVGCMERGHNTFRGFVQQKTIDIDKALKSTPDISDDNDRQVFRIVQELGKKILNLMYEKGPRQTAQPPPIYGGEAPQQRNQPVSSSDYGGLGKKAVHAAVHTDTSFKITSDPSRSNLDGGNVAGLSQSYQRGLETTQLNPRRGGGFFRSSAQPQQQQQQQQQLFSNPPPASSFQIVSTPVPEPVAPSSLPVPTPLPSEFIAPASGPIVPSFGQGYQATGAFRTPELPLEPTNSGELETKLVNDITVTAGVGGSNIPKQVLNSFLEKSKTLDLQCIIYALVSKTSETESNVSRQKAYVILYEIANNTGFLAVKPNTLNLISNSYQTLLTNGQSIANPQIKQKVGELLLKLQQYQSNLSVASQPPPPQPTPEENAFSFIPTSSNPPVISAATSSESSFNFLNTPSQIPTSSTFSFTPTPTTTTYTPTSTPVSNTTNDLLSLFGPSSSTTTNTTPGSITDPFGVLNIQPTQPASFQQPVYDPFNPTAFQANTYSSSAVNPYAPTTNAFSPYASSTNPYNPTPFTTTGTVNLVGLQKKQDQPPPSQFNFMEGPKTDSFDFISSYIK